MGPPVAYFDLLEDGVVQEVIRRIKEPARDSWQSLSCTCRRLCTLVRRTRTVTIHISEDSLKHLLHLRGNRAFSNIRRLSVCEFQTRSLEDWACFTDAVAAAAASGPLMEEAALDAKLVQRGNDRLLQEDDDDPLPCEPGCLSGPLMALRHAPALRRLSLKLHEVNSLTYLPVLTQLTHLELFCEDVNTITVPTQRHYTAGGARPLADMHNLVSLKLWEVGAEGGGPCALPPNLTRLEVALYRWTGDNWAVHLAGCKQLRELQLTVPPYNMDIYPTMLMEGFAEQLTGLVKLSINIDDSNDDEPQWMDRFADALYEGEWGPVEVDDLFRLPLKLNGDIFFIASNILLPPPNLSALSSLQQLHVSGWWLVAMSEPFWRRLAGCSSLRSLRGLHASVPPPAGVTFPGVTFLDVTTSTTPGDTLALLGAFPALREVELTVVPNVNDADEPLAIHPREMQRLSAAHITFKWPSKSYTNPNPVTLTPQGPAAAAYCTPLWAALPGLQRLVVQWPCAVPQSALPLQGQAAHRQKAAIALGALQKSESMHHPSLLTAHVGAGQLLPALQGAAQLQSLELRMELDPSSRDQTVLGLQEALPGLTRLATLDGAAGLAPATLAALRPGLMHALIAE